MKKAMEQLSQNEKLIDKLHDLSYVISQEEIKDLQDLCYSYSNSFFPIGDFFNDIRDNQSPNYNKNQAYKDLYMIMLEFDSIFKNYEKYKKCIDLEQAEYISTHNMSVMDTETYNLLHKRSMVVEIIKESDKEITELVKGILELHVFVEGIDKVNLLKEELQ